MSAPSFGTSLPLCFLFLFVYFCCYYISGEVGGTVQCSAEKCLIEGVHLLFLHSLKYYKLISGLTCAFY